MKKRMYSAIKPTGLPTLGNYLGAMRNWNDFLNGYDCVYAVADLHAITIRLDPEVLRNQTMELYSLLLACGLTKERCLLYVQSMVKEHAELSWVLSCYAMFGEMSRMTQFKDKSKSNPDNINTGLFTYPVLMTADIALFDADLVPVGQDQKQHVEIARDILTRFNGIYGDVLRLPNPLIPELGAKVYSLADPGKKMDKSDPDPNAFINLTDSKDKIVKKLKKAVTDSEPSIRYDPVNKPGVSNLLTIFALCSDKTMEEAEAHFTGKGYGALKADTAEAVDSVLSPIREESARLLGDKGELLRQMSENADRASAYAQEVIKRVRNAVGFVTL